MGTNRENELRNLVFRSDTIQTLLETTTKRVLVCENSCGGHLKTLYSKYSLNAQ